MKISITFRYIAVAFAISSPFCLANQEGDEPSFTVQCTDRSGTTFDVSNFVFNFGYSYPTPGWIGKSTVVRKNPRRFLPFTQDGFVVTIPFQDINTVEFVDSPPDDRGSFWDWEPAVRIQRRAGKSLTGRLPNYGQTPRQFVGETELGNFSLDLQKVSRLEFQHTNERFPSGEPSSRLPVQTSSYNLTIHTWEGKQLAINRGYIFRLQWGHSHADVKTVLDLEIGESMQTVGFDKIKSLTINAEEKKRRGSEAELITISGKSIKVYLEFNGGYAGGILEPFGPGWIDLRKVALIEISK